MAFGSVVSGVYAAPKSAFGTVISIVKGLLVWPTGALTLPQPFHLGPIELVLITINLSFLLYLTLSASSLLLHPRRIGEYLNDRGERARIAAFIWLSVGLGYSIILGLGLRFGGSVLPLLYLFIVLDLSRPRGCLSFEGPQYFHLILSRLPDRQKLIAIAAGSLVGISLVSAVPSLSSIFIFDADQIRAREFQKALLNLPGKTDAVYVINAPLSYSRPGSIPAFLGLPFRLAYINQVKGCVRAETISHTGVKKSANGELTIAIPGCAEFQFPGTSFAMLTEVATKGGNSLDTGRYYFPEGRQAFSKTTGAAQVDFGKRLKLNLSTRDDVTLLMND
jgi:hypothetical protein